MKPVLSLIIIVLLYLPFKSRAQGQQSKLNEKKPKLYCTKLDDKHGYKQIRLGDTVSVLSQFGTYFKAANDLWKGNNDGTIDYKFISNTNYKISENINLKDILVRTYNGKIVSIYLLFNPTDGDMIKDIFSYAYGKPQQPDGAVRKFFWFGKDVSLELISSVNPSGVAIFTDLALEKDLEIKEQNTLSKAAANL